MHLKSLHLRNFRSIANLELEELKSLNCFIGAYNTGKTNILDGISVFWDPFLRAMVQQRHFKSSQKQQIRDFENILSYLGDLQAVEGTFTLELNHPLNHWKYIDYLSHIFRNSANKFNKNLNINPLDDFLDELETVADLSSIKGFIFNLKLDPNQWTFLEEKLTLITNHEFISHKFENLPIIRHAIGSAFIKRFSDETAHEYDILHQNLIQNIKNKNYDRMSAIESFLKDILDQDFRFELGNKEIEVTIENSFTSPLWRLSTNTIRLISIAYLLTAIPYDKLKIIIIIDNPNLYLHPKSERSLARWLESVSEKKISQIFFSTHSTRLLIGYAYLVELKKGFTRVTPIRGEKTIRRVVKLLGIRPSDSFGSDCVVFVEGKTDAQVYRVFEDLLIKKTKQRPRISYIPVGGFTNMKFILSIELLRSKFVRSRAVAITDGDIAGSETYYKIKKNWESVFPKASLFNISEQSVESLFLNNNEVFIREAIERGIKIPSHDEINLLIAKRRDRGYSDKLITKEIIEKYFQIHYSSNFAKSLALKFEKDEIPMNIAKFFNEFILAET